jgi:hypothetical protein
MFFIGRLASLLLRRRFPLLAAAKSADILRRRYWMRERGLWFAPLALVLRSSLALKGLAGGVNRVEDLNGKGSCDNGNQTSFVLAPWDLAVLIGKSSCVRQSVRPLTVISQADPTIVLHQRGFSGKLRE